MTDYAVTEVDAASPISGREAVAHRRGQLLVGYRVGGLVLALSVLLYMMWPNFWSDFGVIDDHTAIDMMGHHSRLPIGQIPHWVLSKTAEPIGRFRPMYWVGQVLESAVVGHHPSLWYFDRYLLAGITVTAVYVTAIRFVGPLGAAALSLLPFSGVQFETWIRLGPNEAYAVPFAVAGVAVLVRQGHAGRSPRGQWLGYTLLLCAAYTKENFLLVAAIGVPATVLAYGWRRLRRPDVITLGVVAVLGLLDGVCILIKTSMHGSVYPQSRSWATIKAWGHYTRSSADPYQGFTTGLILAVVLLGVYAATRQRALLGLGLAAVVALLIVSQLVFYAGNPTVGRYVYPMALAPSVLWGIGLWQARSLAWWPPRLVTSAVLVVAVAWPLHAGIGPGRAGALVSAHNNNAFHRSLRTLEASIHTSGAHLVVLQPFDALTDIERTLSLARYLANTDGVDVMIAPPIERNPGFDAELAKQIDQWSLHGEHNILPYKPVGQCFSVLYGPMPAICGASAKAF